MMWPLIPPGGITSLGAATSQAGKGLTRPLLLDGTARPSCSETHLRLLAKRSIKATMMRRPNPPGQINHPPLLRYPTTTHDGCASARSKAKRAIRFTALPPP